MRTCCLALLFGLIICFCFGQEPSYRVLSTDQGLASRIIYDINQHQNGKMLIGHELGLSVYNGMEVTHYQNNYKTTPLSNLTLYGDEILCRNFYNEVYITQKNKTVKRLEALSQKDSGICTMINYKGKIYKKSFNDIVEFGFDEDVEKSRQIFNTSEYIIDFLCHNDTIYVLTSNYFWHFNIYQPSKIKSKKIDVGKMPRMFFLDNEPAIYCPDFMHVIVNPHMQKSKIISLRDFNINDKSTCVKQLKDGNIYLGTFGGLYIYKPTGELLRRCYKDIQISCIYQDVESNIWLGTIQDGIRIIPDMSIQTVLLQPNEKISRMIVEDNEHLLLGTFDGKLYRIDSRGNTKILHDFKRNNEIQSIYVENESIWLYCVQLYQLHNKRNKVLQEINAFPTKSIITKSDTLFCATSKGVQLVVDKKVQHGFRRELWVKKGARYKNKILFETSLGIMYYENHNLVPLELSYNNQPLDLTNATNLISALGSVYFSIKNCVYQLDENNILHKYDYSGVLQSITKIAAVKDLVFATDGRKIVQFNNRHPAIIDFTKGVVIREINDIIGWNNQLVIIGVDRFQLYPVKHKVNNYPQKLSLSNVSGSFFKDENRYVSSYSGNNLVMNFDYLPNISSVGTGKVYYRLKGVSNDWKVMEYKMGGFQIDERRIPYGKTTLEVYGVNLNHRTSVYRFPLYVYPPYYLRWWFILIEVFVFGFIIWWIYRRRIIVINRKNKLKMEQEQLKTKVISSELKALRSQMNPHFIFNSLSSIQSKILNDETKEAYTNLSAFSKLLRQSLKFTGEEFISLENEIDFLKNYVSLEQGRMDERFEFFVEVDEKINMQEAQFPSLFSQPFVENAIRHGLAHKNGVKELSVIIQGNTLNFSVLIRDNGIGREAANQINQVRSKSHESFATQAMQDRIEMINANGIYWVRLDIVDKKVGTEVKIAICKKNG